MFLEGKEIRPGTGHTEGRQLLAQMYEKYVGAPMPDIAVTAQGKPYFTEGNWHFSISHTRHHVFCALAERNIGLDAEEAQRAIRPELAGQILSDSEYRQYAEAADKPTALLTFWVLKEAQGKLTGAGIKFHPNHTHFSVNDPRVIRMQNCLVAVLQEEDHVI